MEGTTLHEIIRSFIKLRSFAYFEPLTVNFLATQLRSRLPHFRTLRLLGEETISHCIRIENVLFADVLPTPSSLHRQSQRYIFNLSKPNDTNTATTRLHNHVVISSERKQQQTGHILLMSRGTLTNNFLNQQAMLTAMKSRANFLISN